MRVRWTGDRLQFRLVPVEEGRPKDEGAVLVSFRRDELGGLLIALTGGEPFRAVHVPGGTFGKQEGQPDRQAKQIYVGRYEREGSPPAFIVSVSQGGEASSITLTPQEIVILKRLVEGAIDDMLRVGREPRKVVVRER